MALCVFPDSEVENIIFRDFPTYFATYNNEDSCFELIFNDGTKTYVHWVHGNGDISPLATWDKEQGHNLNVDNIYHAKAFAQMLIFYPRIDVNLKQAAQAPTCIFEKDGSIKEAK